MIKHYCDACLEEIKDPQTTKVFEYLCHIDFIIDGKLGYVDSNGNAVSKRFEKKDLCIACYNRIAVAAVKKFREIKGAIDAT